MGDINLLPEDARPAPRHRRPVKGRVEYSSPLEDAAVVRPVRPNTAPQTPRSVPTAPVEPPASIVPPTSTPARDTFSEWWKKRRARAAVPSPSSTPPPVPTAEPQRKPTEHGAPKKDEDIVQMNLAHPAQPAARPAPQHRYAATPAAPPAPQLIRSMPRPRQPTHSRSQQRQLSSGQPMPAADHETVNLLPDQLIAELHPRNRWRELAVTALSSVVVVLLVYGGMNVYQQKIVVDTKQVEEEIAAVDTEIASYAELQTKAQKVDQQLTGLEAVLDGHILWTPFLATLEALTLPTVYYTSVSGSAASGSFTFDAVTAAYDQIDPQIRVLRNAPDVRSVTVSSAHEVIVGTEAPVGSPKESKESEGKRAVAFTMSVEFDPTLFRVSTGTE